MSKSRRGYISFLYFIPLALLLLMPLALRQAPIPALISINAADSALAEQVAFKRALLGATHSTIMQIKSAASIPIETLEDSVVILGGPEISAVKKGSDVAFDQLSDAQATAVMRSAILQNWVETTRAWNENSAYEAYVSCRPRGQTDPIDLSLGDTPSPSDWQACGSLIVRSNDLSSSDRPFLLDPGLTITVKHRALDYSGSSPMRPQEVG